MTRGVWFDTTSTSNLTWNQLVRSGTRHALPPATEEKTMQAIRLLAVLAAATTEVFAEGGTRRIVVSLPDRKIALFQDGRAVKVYPIAVGKHSTPSPSGSFRIASRVMKPNWYQPGKVVPAGPANPLGTRWMGLGYKGYGIHGTNRPKSIGKAASHGCIRMRNQDVEDLFERVEVGDPVELLTETNAELAGAFVETGDISSGGGQ
jgi:lipoprotein-anchoring transpeptidase ErfK/SrfK